MLTATARGHRPWLALTALALLTTSCRAAQAATPVAPTTVAHAASPAFSGGTLRILDAAGVGSLDTATPGSRGALTLTRLYARELMSWSTTGTQVSTGPVPDLATAPPTITDHGRRYTFTLRPNVDWAPPVNRAVTAQDFITAVQRLLDPAHPSPGQADARLIAGARAFEAGQAPRISGLQALGPNRLQITLTRRVPSFLSMLTLPYFAPVPTGYITPWPAGSGYSAHLVGLGPYTLGHDVPGGPLTFIRNPNWNPATDPLRHAWVNEVVVQQGYPRAAIQQAINSGWADLSLDSQPPASALAGLAANPARPRLAVNVTGCVQYLTLNTNPAAGPIGQGHRGLLIRRAINEAVNKLAMMSAHGGSLTGEPASTVLPPTVPGYQLYDLYHTPSQEGDPVQARELLAEAGFPHGITLTLAAPGRQPGPTEVAALVKQLGAAGIHLIVQEPFGPRATTAVTATTALPATHQLTLATSCAPFPGNATLAYALPLLASSSILPTHNANLAELNNTLVNQDLKAALAAPTAAAQDQLLAQADQATMSAAAWVPLLYDNKVSSWSARVRGWVWSPWVQGPDLTHIRLVRSRP